MAGGQWEVVGGKAKKSKIKNNVKPQKSDEKSNETTSFATAGPIAESKTVFNAFLDKERKEQPIVKQQKSNEPVKGKEKNGPSHKKKVDKKAVNSKVSLEGLFASITEEDLKNHLATLEVLIPNSPHLWLKDLVTFFNVKLNTSIDASTITSKPQGFPSSILNKGVYSLLRKTFNRCSAQTLQNFYEHCLHSLVQDSLKGLHILGYCTVLQYLVQEKPSVASANLVKCAELCSSHSNRQNICLLLWWIAGQAGYNDLETGFQIWLQLMFPMIGEKNCSSYAIEYLEELINKAKKQQLNKNIIQVKDFFPILDLIYSKELPKGIQKRLMAVYPTLKLLSYGHDPENVLRHYFPSYLRRLEPQCPQPLKSEILSSLVHSLEKDSRCFSVWRQLYTKHFIQSKLLISHINDEWDNLPSKFPKRCLVDTLSVFQVTNEELNSKPKKSADVEECILVNKELLSKMKASKYSWHRLITLSLFLIAVFVSLDIWLNKSFYKSHVGKLLVDAGQSQAGQKLLYFYEQIQKFFKAHTPTFLTWTQTTVVPYLELFIKKLSLLLCDIWNSTSFFRNWCSVQFPLVLEQIEYHFPNVKESLLSVLKTVSVQVVNSVPYAWSYIQNIFESQMVTEMIKLFTPWK